MPRVPSQRAAADAVVVEHWTKKIPELELANLSLGVPAANLFVERIQKLLPGCRSGKRRSLKQRPAKPPPIEKPFRRPIKCDA